MSEYKGIKGFQVQTRTEDPSPTEVQTGDFYYNSTTGQFKTINSGGAPIGSWSSAGSLNTNRAYSGGSGIATAGVIFGGYTGSTYVANTETYNGTAFSNATVMNSGRGALGYAGATQTDGLAISGVNPYVTNTEKWNGTGWTETGDVAVARNAGSGAGTTTAAIYFGGNHPPSSTKVDYTESFNGSSWSEVAELNTAKGQMAGSGTATAAYAIGGYSNTNLATVEEWNGSSWSETTDINTARRSLGGSSGSGTVTSTLIFGGYASPAQVANTESWNGSTWTEISDMASARSDFAGTGTPVSALASGGEPSYSATEQWTAADFQIKTVTTS
jgi:hypothetical protein